MAKVIWDAAKVNAIVESAGAHSIRNACNFLLDEARKEVPLDTGALSRSGAVDSNAKEGTVSFDTPYAIKVHETHMNFQRGRKEKYLEDPLNRNRQVLIDYLKNNLNF